MAEAKKEDKAFDVNTLSAFEKTALLLLSLTEEDAANILRHLEPKQVQKVGMEMAGMQDFTQERITAVHKKFLDDIQRYSSVGLNNE